MLDSLNKANEANRLKFLTEEVKKMSFETVRMVKPTDSVEKIIRFMEAREGDEIEKVMNLLGRTLEEQLLSSTYAFYRYVYMIYQALSDEFGVRGYPMYMGLWFIFGDWAMKITFKEMGLKSPEDVKDIPTMAEVFHQVMNNYSCINKITESSEDRAVVDMVHCNNPMLGIGPFDRYIDRVRYYRDTDSSYEIGYGKFCSEFANICGQGDKVESKLTHIMCLAEGPTCRTVFEKKKER